MGVLEDYIKLKRYNIEKIFEESIKEKDEESKTWMNIMFC